MKANKYTKVDTLPGYAVSVANFANDRGISIPYVYIKFDRAKNGKASVDYNIVNYQGINFILIDSKG